ncbi:MAG: hypothetical protein SGJ24_12665 [Chloroflexota bacterium]|nr:hypothetical protein [Chloroflexota bacterium]
MLYEDEPQKSKRSDEPGAASGQRPTAKTMLQIMDGTFRIYRDNLGPLLMLSALLIVPLTVVGTLLGATTPAMQITAAQLEGMSSEEMMNVLGPSLGLACLVIVVALILGIIQVVVLNGTIVTIASESLFGNPLTLREAWTMTLPRLGKLFWAYLSFYLILFAVTIVIVFAAAICPPLLLILAFILYISITIGSLIAPVAVLENIGRPAVSRAHVLGKSRFWQVFGISVLIGLVSFGVSLLLQEVLGGILLSIPALAGGSTAVVLSVTIAAIIEILIAPLLPIAMTQMYYDARIRKEGLADLLAAIGPDARPYDVRPVVSDESWIASSDLVNMLIMIGVVVVLTLVAGSALAAILNVLAPGLGDLSSLGGSPI